MYRCIGVSVYRCIGACAVYRCIGVSMRRTLRGPQSRTLWFVGSFLVCVPFCRFSLTLLPHVLRCFPQVVFMFKYPGHQGHLRKKKSGKKRRKQKQPHINVFWTCFLFVCFCFSFVVVGLQSSLKVVVWIFVAFVPVIFQTVVCLFVRISARFLVFV